MLRGYLRSDVHLILLCLLLLYVLYLRSACLRHVQWAGRMPVLVDTPVGKGEELLRMLPRVRELGEAAVAWAVVDMPLDTPAAMPGMFASASVGWIAPSVPSVVVWLPLPVWLPPL